VPDPVRGGDVEAGAKPAAPNKRDSKRSTSATKSRGRADKAQQTLLADLGSKQVFPGSAALLDAALPNFPGARNAAPGIGEVLKQFSLTKAERDAQLRCDQGRPWPRRLPVSTTTIRFRLAATARPSANTYKGITKEADARPRNPSSEGKRVDGRNLDEVRPITRQGRRRCCPAGAGSGLFQRGLTQVLFFPPPGGRGGAPTLSRHPQRARGDGRPSNPMGEEDLSPPLQTSPPIPSAKNPADALPRPPAKSATAPFAGAGPCIPVLRRQGGFPYVMRVVSRRCLSAPTGSHLDGLGAAAAPWR